MIRFACPTLFRLSTFMHKGNILLIDGDMPLTDIPPNGLKNEIEYLSKSKESIEELKEKVKYEGQIIGRFLKMFFSIPTARVNSEEYYNVHYLLDPASPFTTLTHQALCCLYGKRVNDPTVVIPSVHHIIIVNRTVQVYRSNHNPIEGCPAPIYQHLNILGTSFLEMFKGSKIECNYRSRNAILELIQ